MQPLDALTLNQPARLPPCTLGSGASGTRRAARLHGCMPLPPQPHAASLIKLTLARLPMRHAVGIGAIATFGFKGSKDAKLPITVGPLTSGENGKGGSERSRI